MLKYKIKSFVKKVNMWKNGMENLLLEMFTAIDAFIFKNNFLKI